jgi:glutaredoxin-like protein
MNIDDNKQIIMYTTSWCSDCHRSKYFLDEHGIEYVDIDVEHDADAGRLVKSLNNGWRRVPTIIFPDGTILVEPSDAALAAKLDIKEQKDSFPRLW